MTDITFTIQHRSNTTGEIEFVSGSHLLGLIGPDHELHFKAGSEHFRIPQADIISITQD